MCVGGEGGRVSLRTCAYVCMSSSLFGGRKGGGGGEGMGTCTLASVYEHALLLCVQLAI